MIFKNILANRELSSHDGRAFWKYHLSDNEFDQLRLHLTESRSLFYIDPKDCALYYAEWWKRCYNGGSPSKLEIFLSISPNHFFNEEEFYVHARKGAQILGIKWIKGQNTLYFKTLLLQGGLPINHIHNNQKAYASFLLRILQLNPVTIDDFAFDYEITKLLPASSRNEIIYENCLEIVKGENQDFLSVLDSTQELKQIADLIRKPKNATQILSRSKLKVYWILNQENEQYKIHLYLSIPESISADILANIFFNSNPNTTLLNEYQLFVNGDLSCKFKKKLEGSYRTIWFNNHNLNWDGTESLPEVYLKDIGGNKTVVTNLINSYPKLSEPTLWSIYSEKEWVLEKGKNSSHETAFVLFPPDSHEIIEGGNNPIVNRILILNSQLNWINFSDEIKLKNNAGDVFKFGTNKKKFDWYILGLKPEWMFKANLPVVRNHLKIVVFNEHGDRINNPELKWRKKDAYLSWQDLTGALPIGCLEVKIIANGAEEIDELFNIGNLDLIFSSNKLNTANIEVINDQFNFKINQQQEYNVEILSSTNVRLTLTNNNRLPKSISGSLSLAQQRKTLHFELIPPFNGVEILDVNGDIIPNNTTLFIENLYGYRIMSNDENLEVNIYNNSRPDIIISQSLRSHYSPVRELEESIQKLARLSDVMSKYSFVVLEICREAKANGSQKKIKSYQIRNYTDTVMKDYDENNKLVLTLNSYSHTELYAVPVNCQLDEIALYSLINKDGRYTFDTENNRYKFLVFSNSEKNASVLPAIVSTIPITEENREPNTPARIEAYKQKMLDEDSNGNTWQILFQYFNICINNNLPFSTFDILRSLCISSELAAKAFVFFVYSDEKEKFVIEHCKELEDDLGFSFHWISKNDWGNAIEWIGAYQNKELLEIVFDCIDAHFKNLYPGDNFVKIHKYILGERIVQANLINTPENIIKLRSSFGARVLNELPRACPKIPEAFKEILPINDTNQMVKILMKAPLAVALSISAKDYSIWDLEADNIRRNIKYSQELNSRWYSEAICYCLSRLKLIPILQ